MSEQVGGIDVSAFQGAPNWPRVRGAGVGFVIIKATEGARHTSSTFAADWRGAGEAGIVRGAYHFFQPAEDPAEQARHFAAVMGPLRDEDLPPALDVEVARGFSPAQMGARVRTCLLALEQATGRHPILYCSPGWWNGAVAGDFSEYALWVANYGVRQPHLPRGWSAWRFWQWSSSGQVAGVNGRVDMNRFNGGMDELRTYIHFSKVGT